MVNLSDIGKNYKIFVDTCAFMNVKAEPFFKHLTPKINDNKLLVHISVINQLKRLQKLIQGTDQKAKEAAIDLVHRLGAMGHLEFRDVLPEE